MKPIYLCLLLVAALVVNACSSAKIQNMENVAVPTRNPPLTIGNVENAIGSACEFFDWKLRLVKPGKAIATRRVGSHTAQVLIEYSPRSYSINYYDSSNLDHDDDTIHGAYNRWVDELDQKIQKELALVEISRIPAANDSVN